MAQAQALLALHRVRVGDAVGAIEAGRRSIAYHEAHGHLAALSRVHTTVALAYIDAHLGSEALHHGAAALEAARSVGDPTAECWALSRLGAAHSCLGDHARGLEYGREALQIARTLPGEEELSAALVNLSESAVAMAEDLAIQGASPDAIAGQALDYAHEAARRTRSEGRRLPATSRSAPAR